MFRRHRAGMVWMLVVVMTVSPSLVYAQAPAAAPRATAAPPTAPAGAAKFDLGYITPDTVAAAIVFPRRVILAPEMEMLPIEVLSAAGKKELGIDPVEIEQALAIAEPPTAGPPAAGVVLRFATPLGQGKIMPPLWERTTEATLDGKAYRKGQTPMDLSIYMPDDRTLILAHDALLQKMLANHAAPKAGAMSKMLNRVGAPPDVMAVVLAEPLRPLIAAPLAEVPLPPPLAGLKNVPDLVNYIAAKADLRGNMAMSLIVRATDAAAAQKLEQIIDAGMQMARQLMLAEVAKQANSPDPVEQAMAKYSQRVSGKMFESFRPVRKGDTLMLGTGSAGNSQMVSAATIGILIALLLPAVQSARAAARRAASMNNIKQIGLTMFNYEAAQGAFPARASFDKQGKPLLSWRVHMLPYLEEEALYKQFHLDEPWDSANNKKLIPLMPQVYRNPAGAAQPGMANYLAVVGKGLAFEGDKGRKVAEFTDGTSNTILLVEADDDHAVIWTKPDDWEYNAQQPMAGLGRAHANGFNALFADGHVQFIARAIDPAVLQSMLTIAGGEKLGGF